VKTVEANLSRIFHKLGVRSRTELTRRLAATPGQQTTPAASPPRVSPDSWPLHLVGRRVSVAGRTTASEPVPGVPELGVQAPALDPSCRQLIAFPKRRWVCVDHR
jgi:hypothetical protein